MHSHLRLSTTLLNQASYYNKLQQKPQQLSTNHRNHFHSSCITTSTMQHGLPRVDRQVKVRKSIVIAKVNQKKNTYSRKYIEIVPTKIKSLKTYLNTLWKKMITSKGNKNNKKDPLKKCILTNTITLNPLKENESLFNVSIPKRYHGDS